MGTPAFAAESLNLLYKNEYDPIAVYTQPDKIKDVYKRQVVKRKCVVMVFVLLPNGLLN